MGIENKECTVMCSFETQSTGESSGRFDLDYMEVTSSSELGKALFKARVGETIGVNLPAGRTQFEILSIE